jgi:hypothetical protein
MRDRCERTTSRLLVMPSVIARLSAATVSVLTRARSFQVHRAVTQNVRYGTIRRCHRWVHEGNPQLDGNGTEALEGLARELTGQ